VETRGIGHYKHHSIFVHGDDRIEGGGKGMFTDKVNNVDMTRLESKTSFLQMKASKTTLEKLCQVKGEICVTDRILAHKIRDHHRDR
jgi:hypothetical protein